MHNFEKSVPFDPGYSNLAFSFIGNVDALKDEYSVLKANHQKKFWLTQNEAEIAEFIKRTTAFYQGCMLWGGFIHSRFKNSPKVIEGNNTENKSAEELKDWDCTCEVTAMLDYIKSFNRDCVYFLKRPFKISSKIVKILENYVEFAQINNNFIGMKKTDEIKLPKDYKVFEQMTDVQLDELCQKIYSCIASKKIEDLLTIQI